MAKKDDLLQELQELGYEVDESNTVAELEEMLANHEDEGDESTDQSASEEYPQGARFWRTRIAGLFIKTGDPKRTAGEVAPQGVRFQPYTYERFDGDKSKFGYLATNDEKAIKVLEKDVNVEEISEDDYAEQTDVSNPKIKRANY